MKQEKSDAYTPLALTWIEFRDRFRILLFSMSLLGRDEEKEKEKGSGKDYDRDQIDGARILTQKKKTREKEREQGRKRREQGREKETWFNLHDVKLKFCF